MRQPGVELDLSHPCCSRESAEQLFPLDEADPVTPIKVTEWSANQKLSRNGVDQSPSDVWVAPRFLQRADRDLSAR